MMGGGAGVGAGGGGGGGGGGGLLEILGGGMSPSSQNPDPISEKPISNSHIFAFFLTHLEFKR